MRLPPLGLPITRTQVVGRPRSDGRSVHLPVAAIGDPAAPAVVLAHGVGSSARFVAAACAWPLAIAGYRLVVLVQRGHGDATPCPDVADHALDTYAHDLSAVVGSVPGPVAAVGGVSLGGHAAIRAAIAQPRVVCLPGWTGRTVPGQGPHAVVADEVRRVGSRGLLARLRDDAELPSWLRDTLVTDYARHHPASLEAALVALDGADGPTRAELQRLAPPAGAGLAVVGWSDDPGHPLAVAQAWAALGRGAVTRLTLADPDVALTRFGDAIVTALVTLPAAHERALAARHRDDREAYTSGKSGFVAAVVGDDADGPPEVPRASG